MTDPSLAARPATRRAFLRRLASAGAASAVLPLFLASCRSDEEARREASAGLESSTTPGQPSDAQVVRAAECEGYDALTQQELSLRESLGYIDDSPREDAYCGNCRFFQRPEGGSPCGGCQLLAGPVASGGFCKSWVAVAT